MGELRPEAGVGDHRAGRRVDRIAGGADRAGQPAGGLSPVDQVIDLPLPVGGLPQNQGPGHVRVIAVHPRAEIELDEITGRQHRGGGPMVRDGAVRTGGDDGLEGRVVGAEFAHPLIEVEPDLPFGTARPDPAGRDQFGQRVVGDRARMAQRLDLALVLDRPQGLDQVGGGAQLDRSPRPGRDGELGVVVGDGDRPRLEPDDALRCATDQGEITRPGDQSGQIGDLRFRLGRVTAIGAEQRPRVAETTHRICGRADDGVGRAGLVIGVDHQQCRIRAGEAGEVADVDQVGDQQRIDPGADQRRSQECASSGVVRVRHDPDGRRARPFRSGRRRPAGPID